MTTPLRFLAVSALAACLASPAVLAQQSAQEEEPDTLIISDTLNYDDIRKESVFTGNVVLTRGNMTLHSDTLTMREDEEGFQYGTATVESGKRVFLRQENPEKFEVLEARGQRAEYDGKKEEVEMIGKAVVTRFICGKPFDNIQGERVIYRQKTETYQAFGGPNSAAPGGAGHAGLSARHGAAQGLRQAHGGGRCVAVGR